MESIVTYIDSFIYHPTNQLKYSFIPILGISQLISFLIDLSSSLLAVFAVNFKTHSNNSE